MSLAFFLALAACLLILHYVRTTIKHALRARTWGCAPPPRYPTDILGLGTLKEALKANRQGTIPVLLQDRIEKVSCLENRPVTTFLIRQMGRDNIFTCDPANVQAMLATKFKNFELGSIRRHTLYPMFGEGIFTSDGPSWTHSRALLRPQFTRDQVSDLDLEERHVQQAMRAMPVDPATRWTSEIDIQSIFLRLTIDSAMEFLFGKSSNSQSEALRNGGTLPADHFSYLFDRGQWFVAQRSRFERLHWLVDCKESRDIVRKVHDYVDGFVEAALKAASTSTSNKQKREQEKGKDSSQSYIFLEALISTTKDPIELRSQCLNILLAGRDTTASLLSWSILMLARHPKIVTSLRESILADFGPYKPNQHDKITFTSLKSCRALQHFLLETLRLFPSVPINRRTANTATTLPTGGGRSGTEPIYLKPGSSVIYSPFVTHRRKEIWGEDAEEFRPGRWETLKPGWEYLPFNGGPRVCLGQLFAVTEVGYVLVRILQRFERPGYTG
ncbi:cytochrome P450 [Aspergillus karnatakaensis]|uniref:cytochrome P450 n=1 Tax=Aspergillus karnatakaensis TaxID=1810916 RepID=UPI003CCE3CA3